MTVGDAIIYGDVVVLGIGAVLLLGLAYLRRGRKRDDAKLDELSRSEWEQIQGMKDLTRKFRE